MRARSAKTSAVGCVEALVSGGRRKKRWISRTDELTDGNLLWKRTLWAGLVLPAVYVLANPEKLCKEEADGGNEHKGEPAQAATHDGVRVDADDGEEDGKPGGPYDGVKGHGHEVVRGDAVESGEVQRVFYVHEHGAKLDDQTGRKANVSCERGRGLWRTGNIYQRRESNAHASSHHGRALRSHRRTKVMHMATKPQTDSVTGRKDKREDAVGWEKTDYA
jgi:hypothetical protein